MDPVVIEELGQVHPLSRYIGDFLSDLANAGASGHTRGPNRGDLAQFAAHHDGEIGELDAAPVRAYLAEVVGLAPSTRKRKRAAVASFCRWAPHTYAVSNSTRSRSRSSGRSLRGRRLQITASTLATSAAAAGREASSAP